MSRLPRRSSLRVFLLGRLLAVRILATRLTGEAIPHRS